MKPIYFQDALKQLLANHPTREREVLREREVQDPCDFRLYKTLDRIFEFQQCTFCEAITVGNAGDTVNVCLIFERCTFQEPITWLDVKFSAPIQFKECRFSRYVDLTGSRLQGISFEDCTFDERAYFECVTFSRPSGAFSNCLVQFAMATFKDGAEFDGAKFYGSVCFEKTTFFGTTTFLMARFLEEPQCPSPHLNFSYAKLFGYVEFQQSLRIFRYLIGPRQIPPQGKIPEIPVSADFRYVHIHTQHGLRFHTENLRRAHVLGTNLDSCHFSNVRWPMVRTHFHLSLKKAKALREESRCAWIRSLILGGILGVQQVLSIIGHLLTDWLSPYDEPGSAYTRLRKQSYGRSCRFPGLKHGIYDHVKQLRRQAFALNPNRIRSDQLHETVKTWRGQWAELSRAYRDLKNVYEANKDYIYASDFHYAEKELRRINHEVPRPTRFQLQLYWLVSGYGERVLRPIWWFLLIWLFGAVLYYCDKDVTLKPEPKSAKTASATATTHGNESK